MLIANFLVVLFCLGTFQNGSSVPVTLTTHNHNQDVKRPSSSQGSAVNGGTDLDRHADTQSNGGHPDQQSHSKGTDDRNKPDRNFIVDKRSHNGDVRFINESEEYHLNNTNDIHLNENSKDSLGVNRMEILNVHGGNNRSVIHLQNDKDRNLDPGSHHVVPIHHSSSGIDVGEETLEGLNRPENVTERRGIDEHETGMKAPETDGHNLGITETTFHVEITESLRNLPEMNGREEHMLPEYENQLDKSQTGEGEQGEGVLTTTMLSLPTESIPGNNNGGVHKNINDTAAEVRHLPNSQDKEHFKPGGKEVPSKVTTETPREGGHNVDHETTTKINRSEISEGVTTIKTSVEVTEEGVIIIDPEIGNKKAVEMTTESAEPEITEGEVKLPHDGPAVNIPTVKTVTKPASHTPQNEKVPNVQVSTESTTSGPKGTQPASHTPQNERVTNVQESTESTTSGSIGTQQASHTPENERVTNEGYITESITTGPVGTEKLSPHHIPGLVTEEVLSYVDQRLVTTESSSLLPLSGLDYNYTESGGTQQLSPYTTTDSGLEHSRILINKTELSVSIKPSKTIPTPDHSLRTHLTDHWEITPISSQDHWEITTISSQVVIQDLTSSLFSSVSEESTTLNHKNTQQSNFIVSSVRMSPTAVQLESSYAIEKSIINEVTTSISGSTICFNCKFASEYLLPVSTALDLNPQTSRFNNQDLSSVPPSVDSVHLLKSIYPYKSEQVLHPTSLYVTEQSWTSSVLNEIPFVHLTSSVSRNTLPTKKVENNSTVKPDKTTHPHHSHKGTPSSFPPVYINIDMKMTLYEFCTSKQKFISQLANIMGNAEKLDVSQIMLQYPVQDDCDKPHRPWDYQEKEEVIIQMYVLDPTGKIDISLTMDMAKQIKPGLQSSKSQFSQKLESVKIVTPPTNGPEINPNKNSEENKEIETGITVAIAIVSVGGFCCVSLLVLQILIHKRTGRRMNEYFSGGSSRLSMRSMDSIALGVVPKSRPHSGFWNPGLELEQDENKEPSHPLVYSALADFSMDTDAIYQEFQLIPNETPRLSCVPVGAEDKNRFANVIPHPHSRVRLRKIPGEEFSDYINANYVRGYKDELRAYIATQAPMSHTAADFWRMVWEQQSRVILMLTDMDERGQPRCLPYWPEKTGVENRLIYGDFYIVLKKKEVHQEYIVSILEIKDIEKNLVREIRHFWYTCWPSDGTPEPISLVKFVLDTRPYYEDSGAPVIVHCSPGTGRTGCLITIDICMRSYEDKRSVNILNTVYKMRKERAGAVHTRDQYNLIYKAVYEYAVVMSTPTSVSTTSSVATLQNLL